MKKVLRIGLKILLGLIVLILLLVGGTMLSYSLESRSRLAELGPEAPELMEGGITYRDLNKNGRLDDYENPELGVEARLDDLIGQMTLGEKAGAMFITMTGMDGGELNEVPVLSAPFPLLFGSNSEMVVERKMNHFNLVQSTSATEMASWNNQIQKLAERTRLGIPVTVASDPRHVSLNNVGAGIVTPFFSTWCSPLGLAATRDSALVREFGDIARQEYRAVGIRLALSPMADLATEPRWGRVNGTFGEDAELAAKLTEAYILGFQGDTLGAESVACMTKHFAGGGPQKDGEDAHFPYGAEQVYPGNNFAYHLIPFERGAFSAHTAQIMPYYGLPVGQTGEEVAFGYNKEIITGMLREKYGFDGVVCTDWGLVSDMELPLGLATVKPASAFGVEELSSLERVAKILDAGCDMFGGEARPEWIVQLVEGGQVSEARIDVSVRRILRDKFTLGLFDNPYVKLKPMPAISNVNYRERGRESQRKSLVLLKNESSLLPLGPEQKVYVQGLETGSFTGKANFVATPEEADVVVLKLKTPHDKRSKYLLEMAFHQGRLNFSEAELAELLPLIRSKPTVTVMNLERPAVIPEIDDASRALIADFDCEDDIILELIFGGFKPTGRLPFELPSSMEAVRGQREDVPYDSEAPLYPFGAGL